MIRTKETANPEASTLSEELFSLNHPLKKTFIKFQIKPKELNSKEKRHQICKKYREKRKCYVKELETEIESLEQTLSKRQTSKPQPKRNALQSLISWQIPQEFLYEFFDLASASFNNLSDSYEAKQYMHFLEEKQRSLMKSFLAEKDLQKKGTYKRKLLVLLVLLNLTQKLFNYYIHIKSIEDLTGTIE